MSTYIEDQRISQNQVQKRYDAFKKTNKLYLRVVLISVFVLIVSVVLFAIFFIQNKQTSSEVADYQTMIDAINQKIDDYTNRRLLNLSSSNIQNISLGYSGNSFIAIDLSNNTLQSIGLLQIANKLEYLDLRNNTIGLLTNVISHQIGQIRFPKTLYGLTNCTFDLEEFPEVFTTMLVFWNVTIKGIKQLTINNRYLTYFINNTFPNAQKLLLVNTTFEIFSHVSTTLAQLYLQSYNNLSLIQIDSPCRNGITLQTVGNTELTIKNAILSDFSKIAMTNLRYLQLNRTTVINLNITKFKDSLNQIEFQNITGISTLYLSETTNLTSILINASSIEYIVFNPETKYYRRLFIINSDIKKIQNLVISDDYQPILVNNTNLKQFQNNSLMAFKIPLSSSVVSISNNKMPRAKKIYSGYNEKIIYPNLQKITNNDMSALNSLYFPSGKLTQCTNNILTNVSYINLSNNNLNDSAIETMLTSNKWNVTYYPHYINLKNNPIKNASHILKIIQEKFPEAEVDI